MERIPIWGFWIAAAVLVALGVWSLADENWSGVIVSGILAVIVVAMALSRRTAP